MSKRKFKKIKYAIKMYQEALAENVMEDGRSRAEYYGNQLRIAQAAYNYNGYIVTGTRHGCPIMRLQINAIGIDVLHKWCPFGDMIQGFTDQYGNFLNRQEAYVIAKAAGQIIREDVTPGTLYSECYI